MEKAKQAMKSDPVLAKDYFAESAEMYLNAANLYPADEEMRPCVSYSSFCSELQRSSCIDFFKVAFEAYWFKGAPLKEMLPICEIVRSDLSQVSRIWEHGLLCKELPANLVVLFEYEQKAILGIASGQYTFDSPSVSMLFLFYTAVGCSCH